MKQKFIHFDKQGYLKLPPVNYINYAPKPDLKFYTEVIWDVENHGI